MSTVREPRGSRRQRSGRRRADHRRGGGGGGGGCRRRSCTCCTPLDHRVPAGHVRAAYPNPVFGHRSSHPTRSSLGCPNNPTGPPLPAPAHPADLRRCHRDHEGDHQPEPGVVGLKLRSGTMCDMPDRLTEGVPQLVSDFGRELAGVGWSCTHPQLLDHLLKLAEPEMSARFEPGVLISIKSSCPAKVIRWEVGK